MARLRCFAVLLLATVGPCGSEPTTDLFSVEGIVQGAIVDPSGAGVANTWIAIEATYPLASGQGEVLYDSVRSDAAGYYVGRVGTMNLPEAVVPVAIRVWPPSGSGLAPAARSGLQLTLTTDPPLQHALVADFALVRAGAVR